MGGEGGVGVGRVNTIVIASPVIMSCLTRRYYYGHLTALCLMGYQRDFVLLHSCFFKKLLQGHCSLHGSSTALK